MAEDALTSVATRNKFYKDSQRSILFTLIIAVIVNITLSIILFYVITHPKKPAFFATSINGKVTKLYPLNQPNQSDTAILQWANQAAIAAYTYNFVNFRDELQAASGFFTADGWKQFLAALDESNNLAAVQAKKLIVSAVATRPPIILQKGLLNGRYTWRVQMPITVTYQSASEFTQGNYIVTMLITRVSTLNSPRGIGITQFIVGPAGGGVS